MLKHALFAPILSLGILQVAAVAKPCDVTFTKSAPAFYGPGRKVDPSSIRNPGETYRSPTVYQYNKSTKQAFVCFRGEYCYDASRAEIDCSVNWSSGPNMTDGQWLYYGFK